MCIQYCKEHQIELTFNYSIYFPSDPIFVLRRLHFHENCGSCIDVKERKTNFEMFLLIMIVYL